MSSGLTQAFLLIGSYLWSLFYGAVVFAVALSWHDKRAAMLMAGYGLFLFLSHFAGAVRPMDPNVGYVSLALLVAGFVLSFAACASIMMGG